MCVGCTLRFYEQATYTVFAEVRSISDKLCQVEQFTKDCCNGRCTEQLKVVINNIDNVQRNSVYSDRHNC